MAEPLSPKNSLFSLRCGRENDPQRLARAVTNPRPATTSLARHDCLSSSDSGGIWSFWSILIEVRPRKRSAATCSGCHQPAPGYDQSRTPRLFEFIGFWWYLVFLVYSH